MIHTYHGHVLEGYFSAAMTSVFITLERLLARATDRIVAISPGDRTPTCATISASAAPISTASFRSDSTWRRSLPSTTRRA